MNKEEVENFLANLSHFVFCKFCEMNIPRREIGHHYRLQSHIQNLERCRIEGTYEDLLSHHELYVIVKAFICYKKLSDEEYEASMKNLWLR